MDWEFEGRRQGGCVVFFKVAEEWGEFSNMHNDFPLRFGPAWAGSAEALYQAMRFPHEPAWQREILEAPHAMKAKMAAKKEGRRQRHSRPDWEQVQEAVMRWCLRIKLACYPRGFGRLLRASGARPIVEQSRSDRFWGAVLERDGVLRGRNRLGGLLQEVRLMAESRREEEWGRVEPPAVPGALLLGEEVGPLLVRPR